MRWIAYKYHLVHECSCSKVHEGQFQFRIVRSIVWLFGVNISPAIDIIPTAGKTRSMMRLVGVMTPCSEQETNSTPGNSRRLGSFERFEYSAFSCNFASSFRRPELGREILLVFTLYLCLCKNGY